MPSKYALPLFLRSILRCAADETLLLPTLACDIIGMEADENFRNFSAPKLVTRTTQKFTCFVRYTIQNWKFQFFDTLPAQDRTPLEWDVTANVRVLPRNAMVAFAIGILLLVSRSNYLGMTSRPCSSKRISFSYFPGI